MKRNNLISAAMLSTLLMLFASCVQTSANKTTAPGPENKTGVDEKTGKADKIEDNSAKNKNQTGSVETIVPANVNGTANGSGNTAATQQQQPSQPVALTLSAVGNGEKVRLKFGGKSRIVTLEGTETGEFVAGGDPPHRFTTLLAIQKGDSFYLVAKFVSGAAVSGSSAICGGDRPETLFLIQTDKNLNVENMQTEIFASCIYNGAGRYVQGKMENTKSRVSISFDEGMKKYKLFFDAAEAEKGLQLINR